MFRTCAVNVIVPALGYRNTCYGGAVARIRRSAWKRMDNWGGNMREEVRHSSIWCRLDIEGTTEVNDGEKHGLC